MKTPAAITCKALNSGQRMFCPRGINLWWREIWLERVSTDAYSGAALPIQAGRYKAQMLPQFADNRDPNSLASRMRAMRNAQFKSLLDSLPRPLKILDVGGTQMVWETIGLVDQPDVHITILNLEQKECRYENVHSVVGDARDMGGFHDCQFDIVYSNSVIEHVGNMEQMVKMASEVRRVGRRYFVQTPNRYFPIEPHFVFPMFQFLPVSIRTLMVQKFSLGWIAKQPDRKRAEDEIRSINLLSRRELQILFPDGRMMEERLLGLTKSLIIQRF